MPIREENEFLGYFSKYKKAIIGGFAALMFLVFLNPITCVKPGHRGVVLKLGAVSGKILNEGINWRTPFIDDVIQISVQVQKTEEKSQSASKDLQTVSTEIALNYHISPEAVNELYQKVGLKYADTIIEPAILETMKAITAQYSASELITKREHVSDAIKVALKEKLKTYYLIVDEISMKDFQFSHSFSEAIEAKQKSEQEALKASNDLTRIKVEAQQQIATAQAEAESYRLKSQQITRNMIDMELAKKWDGHYPQVMSGGGTLLQIGPLKSHE